ncbi:hypothetical protein N7466_003130 [Penicillium verhagenii]|uniref:uncharacterized protein n=1 Tax=Penicillium verhagenii TaxID=1562060 RepID=UPI00254591DE|nr:uncharacterized protein N7466_003130 [Penicillium verhagenii]KAJ5936680.1 hypothetical protein N7466_003130 [Penicillium verhagenii]
MCKQVLTVGFFSSKLQVAARELQISQVRNDRRIEVLDAFLGPENCIERDELWESEREAIVDTSRSVRSALGSKGPKAM